MARPAAGAPQDVKRPSAHQLGRSQQHRRIEVALHAPVVAHPAPAGVERHPPVQGDHVTAGGGDRLQEARCPGAEMDARDPKAGRGCENCSGVRLHALLVVLQREGAHPAVEELDGGRARGNLRCQVAGGHGRQLGQQPLEGLRLLVHEALDQLEVPAGPTLDQVAGEREWRSAEADHGHRRLRDHPAHGRDHLRRRLFALWHAQAVDGGGRADGLRDHRPHVLDQLEADAHARQRQHDVGEHHGRVDVKAAHGLQRDLGAKIGVGHDVHQPVGLAQLAVLGKRAAGLPHHPDGGAVHGPAAGCVQEAASPRGRHPASSTLPPHRARRRGTRLRTERVAGGSRPAASVGKAPGNRPRKP